MRYEIREHPEPGRRCGRHIHHDPKSKLYALPEGAVGDVLWKRMVPPFNQGNRASCTGNAAVGLCATEPTYDLLPLHHAPLDESLAVQVYSDATEIDPIRGVYPPDDTGSDGLSVAKVLVKLGLASGYQHAFSMNAGLAALAVRAVMVGVNWYDSFDSPDASGRVSISKSAQVRGGHEFEILGVDTVSKMVRAVNSWGTSWGDGGYFSFSFADLDRLLSEQGDVTQIVPPSLPAPTPTPAPSTDPAVLAWWAATEAWSLARHVGSNKQAALAAQALAKAEGLSP